MQVVDDIEGFNNTTYTCVYMMANMANLFKPFIGKWFSNDESHVHYHVDGYRSLAWAVPIEITDVQTKVISANEINSNFVDAIIGFAQMINIETIIMVNPLLI